MASVYDFKPAFQKLLRPLVRRCAARGISANAVTVSALLLSIAAGAALALYPDRRWPLLALPAVLLVRMALNAIDGMLAREHGMASRLGALLNELGDVVSDAALYLPLALVPGVPAAPVVVVVVLAVVGELTGIAGVQIGASRRYDGPLGKSDRAAAFGLLGLLLGLAVPPGAWLAWGLWALAALGAATILNRARRALAEGS